MKRTGGVFVLMLLLLTLLSFRSREVLIREDPPAFFVEVPKGVLLLLGEGFEAQGIHQFSDGILPGAVIELTKAQGGVGLCPEGSPEIPMISVESLEIAVMENGYGCLRRGWMPAGKRMALGIPLHPDRMSLTDWEALPGIGPKLAGGIELDRQSNGDFGTLSALERVRGIGPHRIHSFSEFFAAE